MNTKRATAIDPHRAVDELVLALLTRLVADPAELQVEDLLVELRSRVKVDVGPVEIQARLLAQRYDADVQRSGAGPFASGLASARVADVVLAADQVLAKQPPELLAAEEHLREAEAQHRDTIARLEDAVAAADVDEVVRLRIEAEVFGPQRIEEARATLLDLQLARARSAASHPEQRLAQATQAAEHAEAASVAALAALQAAEREHRRAVVHKTIAETVAARIKDGIQQLVKERDATSARAQADRQGRMRRLAGLPEPTLPTSDEPAIQLENAFAPQVVRFGEEAVAPR